MSMTWRCLPGKAVCYTAAAIALLSLFVTSAASHAAQAPTGNDWPTWRYDAARSGNYLGQVPARLRLQWVRQLGAPAPAWLPEQYKLQFDRSYEPVVMGRQIFVGSMARDTMTAYDTRTGKENWRFYCDGPVRLAPVAWQGKLYVASDDGHLYCLDAERGRLVWKVRLAPSDRMVLGNGRLISAWPVRGGPVLLSGTVYCTAGIWPFMGVFIYALDAETGRVVWENSGTGAIYIKQQHSSPAFAGVAPQGYLAAAQNKLLLTSRTIPACLDATTGKLLHYNLSDRSYGKYMGGYAASIWKDWYFNNRVAYRLSDGLALGAMTAQVMAKDQVVLVDGQGELIGCDLAENTKRDPKSKKLRTELRASALWKAPNPVALDLSLIHI